LYQAFIPYRLNYKCLASNEFSTKGFVDYPPAVTKEHFAQKNAEVRGMEKKQSQSDLIFKLATLYSEDSGLSVEEESMGLHKMPEEDMLEEIERLEKIKVLKAEIKKETEGRYELKNLWREVFGYHVYEQPEYADYFFHYAMGGLFFHDFVLSREGGLVEEDIRVHPSIIGPTGIGKSEANDFVANTVTQIPKKIYQDPVTGDIEEEFFTCIPVGKMTDAGLIGTVETDLDLMQTQRKINRTITNKDGTVRPNPNYRNPVTEGVLQKGDFVIVDEAEKVFKPNKDSDQVQQIFRTAMNRYGSKTNILRNDSAKCAGKVEYPCSASISMTSFKLKAFNDIFLTGGLMQRGILFIDEEDEEKKNKITDQLADSYETNPDEETRIKREYEKERTELLVTKITELKKRTMTWTTAEWHPELRKKMEMVGKENKELIKEYVRKSVDTRKMTIAQQRVFQSNQQRLVGQLIKLAAHNAISENGRIRIEKSDIDLAYLEVLRRQADSISDYLKSTITETKEDDAFNREKMILVNILKVHPNGISKEDLNILLMDRWNLSRPTVIKHLKTFLGKKVFEEKQSGKGAEKLCFLVSPTRANWEVEESK